MSKINKEADIKSLVEKLNQQGKQIPVNLSQIKDFPYQNFSDLLNDFKSGNARLLRFSYAMESSLFSVLASTTDSIKSNLGLFIAYGGILAAIIFAFIYSWWLLILIPIVFIVGTSMTKNAYNNAIFNCTFSSEIIFCFLYFTGQVSVDSTKLNKQFY